MALTPDTRLAEYEILAPIGAGGMGEVYRARDIKLGREVAIKILPEAFAQDQERLARFEREARILASLNHPGIATLHGFESHDGVRFLVMELVEGETLEERIERGPVAIDEAIPVFSQIAEALEAAHDKGVIHRDLKPANIKITPDGRPKVLDFGLAKGHAIETIETNVSESPTLTHRGTSAGVILGTAPYMSPEQARGKSLDKRTDIWAFGCVLFEALTARKAFDGDTVADILGAIVKTEPDWQSIPETTPRKVRELLARCLNKDIRRRLRDMGEAWVALEGPSVEEPLEVMVERRPRTLVLMTLVTLMTTGLALFSLTRSTEPPRRPVMRTEISLPPGTELALSARGPALAISPEGRHIAFIAKPRESTTQLYLRALDQTEARKVDHGEKAELPFFSPDGEWLGFVAGGKLMKVSVSGGAAVAIADITGAGRGASWGQNESIVFNPEITSGLARASADGGEVEALTSIDRERREKHHRYPAVLPGGESVLFTLSTADTESMDDALICVLLLETGEHKVVLEGGTDARYSPSGHLVYVRDGSLLAVPFDLAGLRVTGTPVPVLDGVTMTPIYGHADFSLSRDGTLLYAAGKVWSASDRLVSVDRQGRSEPLIDTPGMYLEPQLSPDGRSLAFTTGLANASNWVYDLDRRSMTRVTFGWDNLSVRWTPDGQRLAFSSNRAGSNNLYLQPADGSSEAERLSSSDHAQFPGSWSPDGRTLVFEEHRPETGWDLWTLSMDGERSPEAFLQTEFRETLPRFSPDGRWIAYVSDNSGRDEVYVRPFPRAEGRVQASVEGGRRPVWSSDGRELFYRNSEKMMVVDVATVGETITLGAPRKLFEVPARRLEYDVAPDGQRFVMIEPGASLEGPTKLNIILNWSEELKRLVPAN